MCQFLGPQYHAANNNAAQLSEAPLSAAVFWPLRPLSQCPINPGTVIIIIVSPNIHRERFYMRKDPTQRVVRL